MVESKELKEKVTTITYDQNQMQYVINLLNSINVKGFDNINAMKMIFDILGSPINDGNKTETK